jgi:2-oxoglutarate decarboxylase
VADTVALTLPAMGESVSEGTVSRWVKAVGDTVKEGETVAEVTTDKVDVEVPSPATGRIAEILVAEGDTVAVGALLARIEPGAGATTENDAAASATAPAPTREPVEGVTENEAERAPESGRTTSAEPVSEGTVGAPPSTDGALSASPLARRAAAMRGVNLAGASGSGPAGLVRRTDVEAIGAAPPARPDTAPRVAAGETVEPLRGPAAALVEHMERSRDIPTATSFRSISVSALDARRHELSVALSAAGQDTKVSFTHLIGYAIARAALEMPEMTAHFARTEDGKPARVPGPPHLGLAVDSQRKDGTRFLVVPVIRDAGQRSFKEFRDEYERLIERARNNTLSVEELRGATITLTNPGGIGTVASVPRLMTGQGAIIAVGAIGYPPEWAGVNEPRMVELGVGKVMTMTSTYDHRIIQGAQSGEFLRRIEALLRGADGFYEAVFASLGLIAPAPEVERPVSVEAPRVPAATGAPDRQLLAAVQAATSLIKAHRTHGHLGAHLDPLGTPPLGDPAMEPATYGLTPRLMDAIPADLLRVYVPGKTLADVLPALRRTYCGTIAFEIEHIASHEQRVWLREHIESGAYRAVLTAADRLRLLGRLTKVDAMERYLRRTFLGQKTFSIEGLDAMVLMLEELLSRIADDGIGEVVMGMAHRGRLAVVAHVVNRPYESILNAFELGEARRSVGIREDDTTGDVKYHLGAVGTYLTESAKAITVRLLSNPSHLEAVDPIVEGWCRAEQTMRRAAQLHLAPTASLPVLIHGDAAFEAQGVVAEVLNLQALEAYTTGGTVHIIANNQVGFTTDPNEGRSTRYASDLAKGYDIPIVHVNADDIEACVSAVRLAYDYRRKYHRDVVIDLIGYRRFGHNETDEPAYTQPLMYEKIRQHPPVRELFANQLVADGLITDADVEAQAEAAYARVAAAHKRARENVAAELDVPHQEERASDLEDIAIKTRVPAKTLLALNDELLSFPAGFTPHSKLIRQMERRRASLKDGGVDWGTAESLAWASLLLEGHPIRLTGQDTVRGTFSQRHLAFHDEHTGDVWIPMQHIPEARATFEAYNSPLSELACLGFEYGYSAADPETFVLWEAQYGDFFNAAQVVVDQFIVSARAKWGQHSRLTLLLPHGYEGSGPEHSSARIERFLQLSADGNMRVANCSTAAQYFHLLRNQGISSDPRPLVIFTPKSLLRLKDASCTLGDLSEGRFHTVIEDASVLDRRDDVTTLLLCSGRIYYDLILNPARAEATNLAIARVELLHPLPLDDILALIKSYPNLQQVFWVQEEPANMGAWNHLERAIGTRRPANVRWDYIGRTRRASPSEGYAGSHHLEQERIVSEALGASRPAPVKRAAVAATKNRSS